MLLHGTSITHLVFLSTGVYSNQNSNVSGQSRLRIDKLESDVQGVALKVHTHTHTAHIHTTHSHPQERMRKCRNRLWENSSTPGPACLVAVKRDRSRIPLEAESARTDSTEGAHDVSAMKVMTGRKASTNQKHSPSTSVCELIPGE